MSICPDDKFVPYDMLVTYFAMATSMSICPDDKFVPYDMLVTVNILSDKMSTLLHAVDNYVGILPTSMSNSFSTKLPQNPTSF